MVRLVTENDTGLKILRNAPPEAETTQIIDIVAVHGLGAHPDDSWCKNIGTVDEPKWFNWLVEDSMLPAVAPHARIMRYGYQSEWFGKEAMQQSVSTVADRLLRALKRRRRDISFRPLLFVAHCFGGLVVLKALQEAEQYQSEWPGVFRSTTGLVFFGTPFRGAEGMNQVEMLDAARREYNDDQIQPAVLDILQPGNAFLKDLVDGFLKKIRGQVNKTEIACFFELKASNVGRIVGNQDRTRFVVNEHAGCLDLSESINKRSLSRTHFNMNKFGSAEEEDFELVAEVVESIVNACPGLVSARSQYRDKHKIHFSLKGIPILNQFIQRTVEMEQLKHLLLDGPTVTKRRRVVVLHGLGGIGKTQLAVEFAREYHDRFSSVFWLDGSSEESLKKSFVDMLQRLPRTELTAEGVEVLKLSAIDIDKAMRECLRWLSLPTNGRWLMIFDNVDRDFPNAEDPQAYDVKTYFPDTDHGSILITSRLARLQKHGSGIKVGTVGTEQAKAMLESNAGRKIEDADIILNRLSGLPLALTQAGSYLQETNMDASAYVKHYDDTWERLMQCQGRYPLQEYGDRNILTTWTISYEQVQKQSEGAASLLKLWGFLDNSELWYKLISATSEPFEGIHALEPLLEIAEEELAYTEAMGLLSRYSLVDAREDSNSHSMHSVLHQWCRRLAEDNECYVLGYIAAGIVAANVFQGFGSWRERKRLMSHAVVAAQWLTDIPPAGRAEFEGLILSWMYENLGDFFSKSDRIVEAEAMYERALQEYRNTGEVMMFPVMANIAWILLNRGRFDQAESIVEHTRQCFEDTETEEAMLPIMLGIAWIRMKQGRLDDSESILKRILRVQEEKLGPEHTLVLRTFYQLGLVYLDQNQLDRAESMFQRVLQGFEKTVKPEKLSTYEAAFVCMWALSATSYHQGRVEEAKFWCTKALLGYETMYEPDNINCQDLRRTLAFLDAKQEEAHPAQIEPPVQRTSESTPTSIETPETSPNPEWHESPQPTQQEATPPPQVNPPSQSTPKKRSKPLRKQKLEPDPKRNRYLLRSKRGSR